LRNYIKLWYATTPYRYLYQGNEYSAGIFYLIADEEDEANEQANETVALNYSLNQNLPPDYTFETYATPAAPKWLEMNKENIMSLLNPNQVVEEVFVDESPRESWSHGH